MWSDTGWTPSHQVIKEFDILYELMTTFLHFGCNISDITISTGPYRRDYDIFEVTIGDGPESGNRLMPSSHIDTIVSIQINRYIDFVRLIENTKELCAWPLLNQFG